MSCDCLHFRYVSQGKRESVLACADCGAERRSAPTVWDWVARSFGKWRRKA